MADQKPAAVKVRVPVLPVNGAVTRLKRWPKDVRPEADRK